MDLKTIEPVTAKEILTIFRGLPSKGQLMKLCELGVIKPYREAKGTGSNRLFDWYNLIEIAIWKELYTISLSSFNISEILALLRMGGFREGELHDKKDFIVFKLTYVKINNPDRPNVSSGHIISLKKLSRIELSELISSEEWLTKISPTMPQSMTIIDVRSIRSFLTDYFTEKEGGNPMEEES